MGKLVLRFRVLLIVLADKLLADWQLLWGLMEGPEVERVR